MFADKFPKLSSLRKINLKVGTAVPVCENAYFLYNLITKKFYWEKPEVICLKNSLLSMRAHAEQFGVKQINVPRLGAGLDGLDFYGQVLPVITSVFGESAVNVIVHSFENNNSRLSRYVLKYVLCLG